MCVEKVSGEKAAELKEDCEEMKDVPMEDRYGKCVVLSALGQHMMRNEVRPLLKSLMLLKCIHFAK